MRKITKNIFIASLLLIVSSFCISVFASDHVMRSTSEHHKVQSSPKQKIIKSHVKPQEKLSTVNLNIADEKALTSLKGIGNKKAKVIVAYRNEHGLFESIAELSKVKGISDKFIARLLENNPDRLIVKKTSKLKS